MLKKIFVGNLPFTSTEADLRSLFEQHGNVQSVKLITNRDTGQSRGFGFIEMEGAEADNAMEAL
ncbi:MAG: RNA-binding protein, partial [Magnetococcales bacterium]|nr:RNA-binding protein [Magnetococcales bacterium]